MTTTITELRQNAQVRSNWQETGAARIFHVTFSEDVYPGQAWVAHQSIKSYLMNEPYNRPLNYGNFIPFYPGAPQLVIDSIDINQNGEEPIYIATVGYRTFRLFSGGLSGFLFPPWSLPWNISIGFSAVADTPTMAWQVMMWNNTGATAPNFNFLPETLIPILNSASGPFDPPPEEEAFLMTMVFRGARNPEAGALTPDQYAGYQGTINVYPVRLAGTVFQPYYLRIKNINVENNFYEDALFQEITVEIEYNPKSWFRTIIDQGPFWLMDDGSKKAFTIEGETTDVEQQLNGYGKPRGWVSDEDPENATEYALEGPTFIQINTKYISDFNELGLPTEPTGII